MTPVIIIPAFNPPNTFSKLIQSIRNITSIPIIIVDDGSYTSIEIGTEHSNIYLFKNKINRGKGFSLLKGFIYAYEQGFTHSITLDADSQHDPVFINEFISVDENISIVCGKRHFKYSMPYHRRLSNIITSNIVSYICNTNVYDSQCGYRRYRLKDIYKETFIEQGYQFETEVLINNLLNGFKISHINISTIYSNNSSTIRNIYDTFKFLKLIIRFLFKL